MELVRLIRRLILTLGVVLTVAKADAATYYSIQTGNWNAAATWSSTPNGTAGTTYPVDSDVVYLQKGFTVTLTANAACASLNFTGTGTTANILNVASYALTVGDISFTSTTGTPNPQVNITTGTLTVNGNVTQTGTVGLPAFNITNTGKLRLGGQFLTPSTGTLTTSNGSTVEYFGAQPQTITGFTYNHLTLSGIGAKTMSPLTVLGNLTISLATTMMIGSATVTVNGNIANNGTIDGGTGTLSISTTIANTGTFNAGTGTVIYAGGDQTVAGYTYYNLILGGSSNSKAFIYNTTVIGLMTIVKMGAKANISMPDPNILYVGSLTLDTVKYQKIGQTFGNEQVKADIKNSNFFTSNKDKGIVKIAGIPIVPTVSANSTICYNTSPGVISVSAFGGNGVYTYQWYQGTTPLGTAPSFTPGNLTATTTYYCVVTSNGVPANSSTVTVTVLPNFSPGAIATTGEVICLNGDPSPIISTAPASGGAGSYVYQWQYSTTGNPGSFISISGATSPNYDPPAGLQVTTWYRRLAADGICNTSLTPAPQLYKVTVLPLLPVSVTITAKTTTVFAGTTMTFTATVLNGGAAPAYQWKVNGVNVGTNSSTFSYVPSNNDAVTCIVTSSEQCTAGSPATSNTIIMSVVDGLVWNGSQSIEWEVAVNWTPNTVPVSTSSCLIPSGTPYAPTLATQTEIQNLQINSGATVTVAGTGAMTVTGILYNDNGTGGFVILSTPTATGSLIANNSNVPATVQRYISGNDMDWHFLSSPVSTQTIQDPWLPAGTYANGTGYDLYLWDEPTSCWIYYQVDSLQKWERLNPGHDFVPGRGYLYSLQAPSATNQFGGTLNNGFISYGLSVGSPLNVLRGFNFVGNPYPSSIDWMASSGWGRSNLVNSGGGYDMWIWNASAQNYSAFNSQTGAGINGGSRYIAPMQGYFVQAQSAGPLTTDNNVRTHAGAGNWKSAVVPPAGITLSVHSGNGAGSDEVQLLFGYEAGVTGTAKLFSPVTAAPSLYLPSFGSNYSIRYLTGVAEIPFVPVSFKPGVNGVYTFSCNVTGSSFEAVMLQDRQTGITHNLKTDPIFQFRASTTDDPGRFVLTFTNKEEAIAAPFQAKVYAVDQQLMIDLSQIQCETMVSVYDLTGRLLLERRLGAQTLHSLSLQTNTQVLVIRLQNQDGSISRKLIWNNK